MRIEVDRIREVVLALVKGIGAEPMDSSHSIMHKMKIFPTNWDLKQKTLEDKIEKMSKQFDDQLEKLRAQVSNQ